MPVPPVGEMGVRVGLEIHQQLATGKLFCRCVPADTDGYLTRFRRVLRASRGESGEFDPAALFEGSRSRTMVYHAHPDSSCLVEEDERPPDGVDPDAKHVALVIASALGSHVFGEICPMRKTVVDGSNTTGFQRTMLVSQGGSYEAGGTRVGIQSVCLEEDAARILGGRGDTKEYGLERLGIPLVEIATEPLDVRPGEIKGIALALGRILRGTGRVRRGIGSIRQDVNVSIRDGGGAVVEVKGVQQLDQLERVVEYEAGRQYGMLRMSEDLKDRGFGSGGDGNGGDGDGGHGRITDITGDAKEWDSKVIGDALAAGHGVSMVVFENLAGAFGAEHVPGVRLGRDLAELAKAFGLGGIFHSDELPAYGITQDDIDGLARQYGIDAGRDAFVLLAAPPERAGTVINQILARMRDIRDGGIPRDTRLATQSGQTRFLRPRPGAARMYPETDIPVIRVTGEELRRARADVPPPWEEAVGRLRDGYGLNRQLAEQVFDSRYANLFEEVVRTTDADPTFAASVLCSSITALERKEGMDASLLKDADILATFGLLGKGRIAKESVAMIFKGIMSGRAKDAAEAARDPSIRQVGGSDLEGIIKEIAEANQEMIREQGERAMGPLMGIAMKRLRGRASGEAVSRLLLEGIRKRLQA